MENFTLNNGVSIPPIAFGPGPLTRWANISPFQGFPGAGRLNSIAQNLHLRHLRKEGLNIVRSALRAGARLIDYAHAYKDERLIAKAVQMEGIKRDEVFLTSRASNKDLYTNRVYESCLETLRNMGLDYLDLYMFHWPVPEHFIKAYQDMERLYKEGKIRAIGVCNCHQHHLQTIMDCCEIIPAVNQFELHPLFTRNELVDFCFSHGIRVEAYTSLARNDDRLKRERVLIELGKKYHKSHAQIILRWHHERGVIPVFKSYSPERIKSNLDIADFSLTREEVANITALNLDSRLRYDPDRSDLSRL